MTKENESDDIEKYKELMITHPHQEKAIEFIYGVASEDDDLAPMMTEEELDAAQPRSIQDIETVLDAMRELGFAVQDL